VSPPWFATSFVSGAGPPDLELQYYWCNSTVESGAWDEQAEGGQSAVDPL